MSREPAHGPGRDEDPARHAPEPEDNAPPLPGPPHEARPPASGPAGEEFLPADPDWMDDAEWAASLAAGESGDEPGDPGLDPEDSPGCRRPASTCDFEHNIPYEAGGRTCTCNGGPKCRRHHRLKQHPRWKVEQPTPAVIRWTTPTGRQYTTEPTRYPV